MSTKGDGSVSQLERCNRFAALLAAAASRALKIPSPPGTGISPAVSIIGLEQSQYGGLDRSALTASGEPAQGAPSCR